MNSIVKKELTSLKPFLILILCMCLYTIVYNLVLEAQNLSTIDSLIEAYSGDSYYGHAFIYLIFAFALTSGLIMREYDEKTIEFLGFLPVSLGKVFIIKFLLSVLIICLLPAVTLLYGIITHFFSRHSLLPGFHLDVLLIIFVLHTFQIMFLIALGILLSFFRRFSWILMALIFWLYVLLEQLFPGIGVFNIFKITMLEFKGGHVLFPWKMLLSQTVLMGILFSISYVIFVDPGKNLFEIYENLKNRSDKKVLLYLVTLVSIILCGSVFIYSIYSDVMGDTSGQNVNLTDSYTEFSSEQEGNATSEKTSRRYQFEYPGAYENKAGVMMGEADLVYLGLAGFFDYEHAFKIHVDMKGKSRNYAGLAHWQNIYLNLASMKSVPEFKAILAHETTHVFLENMSDRRLSNDSVHNKFFHEGMATYLEYIKHRQIEEYELMREQAAAAYALRPLSFSGLVDYDQFRKYYNHMLIYHFGFFYCKSLLTVYDREAVRNLLHVLATKEETFKLTGMEKWRAVFQYAGLDPDKVFLHFQQEMKEAGEEYAQTVTLSKNVRAAVDTGADRIVIIPDKKALPQGWSLQCLVRNSADDRDENLSMLYLYADDRFYVKKSRFHRSGFWYQLYLKKNDGTKQLYFPWKEVSF